MEGRKRERRLLRLSKERMMWQQEKEPIPFAIELSKGTLGGSI